MNHAITVGDILRTIGLISGLLMLAFGALAAFAGGMSDNGEAGQSATSIGCAFLFGGMLLFGGCLWGLIA